MIFMIRSSTLLASSSNQIAGSGVTTCVKQGKAEIPKIKRELTAKAQTVEVM